MASASNEYGITVDKTPTPTAMTTSFGEFNALTAPTEKNGANTSAAVPQPSARFVMPERRDAIDCPIKMYPGRTNELPGVAQIQSEATDAGHSGKSQRSCDTSGPAPGGHHRNRDRAEELQGDRHAQRQNVDRLVKADIHAAQHDAEQGRRSQVTRIEAPYTRAAPRQQHNRTRCDADPCYFSGCHNGEQGHCQRCTEVLREPRSDQKERRRDRD